MNVQELREALAELPAHWPVHVAVEVGGTLSGTDYFYTLDVQRDNFPTQGNMAVIRLDMTAADARDIAWSRRTPAPTEPARAASATLAETPKEPSIPSAG